MIPSRKTSVWGAIFLSLTILAAGCSHAARAVKTAQVPVPAPEGKPAADRPAEPAVQPQVPPPLPVLEKDDINGDPQVPVLTSEESEKQAARLLEDGFVAYQEAQSAFERGDMDGALARLDEAYGIILKMTLPADSPLLQDKNDLRILIAQRIQQVSATQMTTVPSVNNSIPLVENQWVTKEIASFQTVERRVFEEGYKRSGLYKDMIVDELRKAGLPEQLVWVPLIESWFKVRALSRARALGMWQFISSTGYRYGLKRDKYVDERMDPVKSTLAAITHLNDLHGIFGEWTTALAAYNCGEANVQRTIRAQRIDYLDNFWDLFGNLPWETARYVPRFIAAVMIIENPEKYGFDLPTPDPPIRFETISVNSPVKLAGLAQTLGIDPLVLTILNSELRFDSTPNYEYELRVPEGYCQQALAACSSLPKYIPPDAAFSGWHTVRRGETLGQIARRYRTSVSAFVRINGLRSSRLIYPGQKLKIPGTAGAPSTPPASPPPAAKPGETIIYVVRPGDTLFQLARTYNTTVERIKTANSLVTDDLAVGQRLSIDAGKS